MALSKNSLEEIKSSYKKAQEASNLKLLLLNLFDYFSYLIADKKLFQSIESVIKEEEKRAFSSFIKKKKVTEDFLTFIWNQYKQYCKDQNIQPSPLTPFDGATCLERSPTIEDTGDTLLNSYSVVTGRLINLAQYKNHVPFVSQFAVVACSHIPRAVIASPPRGLFGSHEVEYQAIIKLDLRSNLIDEYLDEQQKLDNKKHIATWYNFQLVLSLYQVYIQQRELPEINQNLERWRISELSKTIISILNRKNFQSDLNQVSIDDLKYSLQKVHTLVLSVCQNTSENSIPNPPSDPKHKEKYYDEEEGILYPSKTFFSGTSLEGRMLSLFFTNNGKPIQNKIHWQDIADDFSSTVNDNDSKTDKRSRVYNTSDRINKKVGYKLFTKDRGYFSIPSL